MADTWGGSFPDYYCQDCGKKGCRVMHCGSLVLRKEHGTFCSPCWRLRLQDEKVGSEPRPFKFKSDGTPYPTCKPSPQEVPDMGDLPKS